MEFSNYQDFWDTKASSPKGAIAAVDGSPSEDVLQHTGRWSAHQVRQALDIQPDDHVLELGCGVGRIGRELAPHCGQWTGTDISGRMLEHARERLNGSANTAFHQLTRSALDMVADDSVDKAYSIAVFCHMDKEDLYLYLCDLYRVMRPGGLIFVETWNLAHPVGWRRWAYEPLVWSRHNQGQRKDVARNQFCTPQEFELYVSHAGFEVLANYNESQSVQIIAGKDLDAARIVAERDRLARVRGDVAYSPLYATFFGLFVDMLFGTLSPADMLASLDRHADTPEAILFRPYILSLWEENAEHWGPAPAN
jgi:cyclopropane fatty-acyl-phospholipid synthase-like methyltransferase